MTGVADVISNTVVWNGLVYNILFNICLQEILLFFIYKSVNWVLTWTVFPK